ncbi:hypothetical protein lerEdw1_000657 [Lerista edwardsae]|nr:hypothetical protein lerEdw1_000657 [Lerista edwardsae]
MPRSAVSREAAAEAVRAGLAILRCAALGSAVRCCRFSRLFTYLTAPSWVRSAVRRRFLFSDAEPSLERAVGEVGPRGGSPHPPTRRATRYCCCWRGMSGHHRWCIIFFNSEMSCTIEKALADAKALVERLREHDNAAEALIEQTTALNKRVEAMKQYQEEIQELNEVARHRPRSSLVLGIQQENRQIRELQQENKELHTSLEEHQSALELIMSKYREQMFRLLMASKKDDPGIIMKLKDQHSKDLQVHVDQITEMAAVMRKAIEIDEQQGCKEQERIFQLEQENKGLREILQITRESFLNLKKDDASESTSLSAFVTNSDLNLRKS